MSLDVILIGNDQDIELDGLREYPALTYINDATVTFTIRDRAGNVVAGQTFPATMAYVSMSNGLYRGTLSHNLALTPYQTYIVEIYAAVSNSDVGFWRFERSACYRDTMNG